MAEYFPKYYTLAPSIIGINEKQVTLLDNSTLLKIDGDIYNDDLTILYECNSDKERFVVPENVKRIADFAFYHCESLSLLIFPKYLESIGANVFYKNKLKSLFIPNHVREIGRDLISDINGIVFSVSNLYFTYDDNILYNKDKTILIECNKWKTHMVVPLIVKEIGEEAFDECINLVSIDIPNSVLKINNSAFGNCRSLATITLPNSLETLSNYTFAGCERLKEITIPCSIKKIGKNAFMWCNSLTSIVIPENVEVVYSEAFFNCAKLKSITILNPNIEMGMYAFSELSQDAVIYIPKDSKQLKMNLRLSEYEGTIRELTPKKH